jgi:hypothetical protein
MSSFRRRPSRPTLGQRVDRSAAIAPGMFLSLSANGSAVSDDQRSPVRRAATAFAVLILTFGAPMYWASGAQASGGDGLQAVVSKSSDDDRDDDDDDAGGDGTNSNRGTGVETRGNTDAGGQNTGGSTRGETDGHDRTGATERTQGTGVETGGKTDAGGQNTGGSTRGETDGNDGTGATERTQGSRGSNAASDSGGESRSAGGSDT